MCNVCFFYDVSLSLNNILSSISQSMVNCVSPSTKSLMVPNLIFVIIIV